ncbi:MAG: hypothetical protein HY445_03350 [Candidatus Niyogibacteria bacterium]|nr:hypothetical protein [Candidatus Niyogibacteria bacterium]
MAWWTHILFINGNNSSRRKRGGILNATYSIAQSYLKARVIDILYVAFAIFTYLYIFLSAISFFFHDKTPSAILFLIEALSDPYLGALGLYIVIRDIERRRKTKNKKKKSKSELFVPLWVFFLVCASLFLFFVPNEVLHGLYKIIVTNAVAAVIMRIGIMLR